MKMENLNNEQKEYMERYAYAMKSAGALQHCTDHNKLKKGLWKNFKIQYLTYKEKVPEKIRKTFRWNYDLESTFQIFSEIESWGGI
jgi:hypothetical protein